MLIRSSCVAVTAVVFTGTASAAVQINEFEPNPFGSDLPAQNVELRGIPNAPFSGSLVSVEADVPGNTIDSAVGVSGTFDANGLLTVSIPDLENPSFTLVLLDGPAPATGIAFDIPGLQASVLDAIGIPDFPSDEANLIGATLGGTDFLYTGDEPKLVFRDSINTSTLWALNDPDVGVAYRADGTTAAFAEFVTGNPAVPSFGDINPSTSAPTQILINEFEPNPFGSDLPNQNVELRGTPGEFFSGSLVSVEADVPGNTIDRAVGVSGTFDANGLLTVSIPDLENPSFTLILLEGVTPAQGTAFDIAGLQSAVLDAIGIPDFPADEANLLGAALGGTDFNYTGDEPKLVFRDSVNPSILWALNDPDGGVAYQPGGATSDFVDFNINPSLLTFGADNPTIVPEPATAALVGLGVLAMWRGRRA